MTPPCGGNRAARPLALACLDRGLDAALDVLLLILLGLERLLGTGSQHTSAVVAATEALLNVLSGEGVKIVVVGQFIPGHDGVIASKESHARLAGHDPFNHAAVGGAGVVDESGHAASCCINDHGLNCR